MHSVEQWIVQRASRRAAEGSPPSRLALPTTAWKALLQELDVPRRPAPRGPRDQDGKLLSLTLNCGHGLLLIEEDSAATMQQWTTADADGGLSGQPPQP